MYRYRFTRFSVCMLFAVCTLLLSSCGTRAPRVDYRELARAAVRLEMDIDANSDAQRTEDCRKVSKRQLKEGDLVFFHNGRRKRVANHVGIYLKDGKFVHASTSSGVIVSRLEEPYYRKCWMQGGRVKGL